MGRLRTRESRAALFTTPGSPEPVGIPEYPEDLSARPFRRRCSSTRFHIGASRQSGCVDPGFIGSEWLSTAHDRYHPGLRRSVLWSIAAQRYPKCGRSNGTLLDRWPQENARAGKCPGTCADHRNVNTAYTTT